MTVQGAQGTTGSVQSVDWGPRGWNVGAGAGVEKAGRTAWWRVGLDGETRGRRYWLCRGEGGGEHSGSLGQQRGRLGT